ncbi:MAG: trypsin-like serine protease [Ruminococcaceae bacterium]|nr:trypsin-like serine protease [Oscillospiraceae bacterium]
MNKNGHFIKKTVSVLLLACMLAGTLVSCSGESAYEIAVRNGFEGSEAEWLESLAGKDGANGIDGKDGANGTNGKDGVDGTDGKDGKDGVSTNGDAASSAAKAIRSAVSIFCKFKKYNYQGAGKDPTITEFPGNGAGIIYKLDKEKGNAYVVTNHHVVYDRDCISKDGISEDISIYLYGLQYKEMAIKATYIGGSSTYDLAVLKIENSEILKSANVVETLCANSDDISVGTLALAIGNPNSDGISVSSGIVSVDSESVDTNTQNGNVQMRLMRIDTPLNHGNSGGGLFDGKGRLIGVVNAKLEASGISNIGYAIPSNVVCAVANNIIGRYESGNGMGLYKAVLGIVIKSESVSSVYDEENDRTLIRESVIVSEISDTSAVKGLLSVGDKIISVSSGGISREVNRRFTVNDFILSLGAGSEVTFKIERNGEIADVKVTLPESIFSRVA